MQLILNLLNKDFKFTDNQLHDALRRSSGGLFNSQHGLGKIVDRFAKNEFQTDADIGNAFVVTKTTLKINDILHLYNLAQAFRQGDKTRNIKQNPEKYAICLALICHQQLQQNVKDFDFKYLDELYAYYAADKKMEPAIKAKRVDILNLSKLSVRASLSLARVNVGSKSEEKKDSATDAMVVPQLKQPQLEKVAQQATDLTLASSEVTDLVPPPSLKRALSGEGSKKLNLSIEIPQSTVFDASFVAANLGPLNAASSNLDIMMPAMPAIHIDTPSPSDKKDGPVNRSTVSAHKAANTPPSTPILAPRLSISVSASPSPSHSEKKDSPVNQRSASVNETPVTPPSSPVLTIPRLSVSIPGSSAPLPLTKEGLAVSPRVLGGVKEGTQAAANLAEPSYPSIYQAQEKARWWKTALALAVAILTLPTIVIPVLSYVLWRRAKQSELIQKVELTASSYASLKEFRHGLNTPKLENEKNVKPHKQVVPATDPNNKSVYYLDKEQAKRFQFFNQRLKQGQTTALNEAERQMLLQSKQESVKLAPRLGG